MRPEGEILYESGRSQQNTVNGGLSARPAGWTGKPGAGACDLWRIRNWGMCFPRVSFPPCLTPAIDGIFRPGGGRLGTDSRDVRENLPVKGKLATREGCRLDG